MLEIDFKRHLAYEVQQMQIRFLYCLRVKFEGPKSKSRQNEGNLKESAKEGRNEIQKH
jgi:hypothetical protein